jgi:hypothetical protein
MHFRKLLLAVTAVAVVNFSAEVHGQGLIDGIKVTLPERVTIGDKVLEPGEYEIRRPSSANRDILQIFNKNEMVYETNMLTVPTGPDSKDPKETKVLLHHIGDAYYFDKIWMEDRNYGWEFPLPERVRALQRENALSVPARYESQSAGLAQAAQAVPGPGLAARLDAIAAQAAPGPGLAARLDAIAAQAAPGPGLAARLDAIAAQDARQLALAESDRQRAANERQDQLERDRQAQLDRERLERDRVAALQRDPSQSDARVTGQSGIQRDAAIPAQLPDTATNWVALLLSGLLLMVLSFFLRPVRTRG